jgi:uncharacterized GH25 family protein
MRFILAKLSLALVATSTTAHDFWLQPDIFVTVAGQSVPFTIQVGHGDDRERWAIDPARILMMKMVGPDGTVDLRPTLGNTGDDADISPVFSTKGLYVVAVETNHAVSDLPAEQFTEYAKTEGLTPALNHRFLNKTTANNGREIYSRRAKSLIRVGPNVGPADPRATRAIGLTLEIVPERDPYVLGKSRNLPVHVLFEGKRLAGATVKLTNLESDEKPISVKKTDKTGRATFRIPESGTWLMNVVWTKPISGRPNADFDTIFSSVTFGRGSGTKN